MTTVISGSSPSITFSDSTTQTTAFTSTPSITTITTSSDASISGLTVGKGAGALDNTVVGRAALAGGSQTGTNLTAIGLATLNANSSGGNNTAIGASALQNNTTASNNTHAGYQAGFNTTTGGSNSAFGVQALLANTSGTSNVGIGQDALRANTTASNNTAVGYQAGYSNTTGVESTAIGYQAFYTNTTGVYCTAVGTQALYASNANSNTGVGYGAGSLITSGAKNTIIGRYNGNQGGLDIRTASNYIVLSDGDGNPRIYVDNNAKVFLGRVPNGGTAGTDTTVISNTTNGYQLVFQYATSPVNWAIGTNASNNFNFYDGGGTAQMYINASNGNCYNRGGTWGTISDIKVKENIVDATPKLDDLLKLKVRNFNLKDDEKKTKLLGFIAQEIEEVFPAAVDENVDYDADGNETGTFTKAVKTTLLVPMLVKAIQELNAKVTDLEAQLLNLGAK
jgi:hypothetical protein